MRIAELSRRSEVPVPSIKYYLRAGLLPPGERTAPNQADYTETHVHRLRLIRALVEVGGLSIAAVGDLLKAIDSSETSLNKALGLAMRATLPSRETTDSQDQQAARDRVQALLKERNWLINPDSHKVDALTSALAVMYRLGPDYVEELVKLYADVAEDMAPKEVAWAVSRGDRDSTVESAIIGTFVGAAIFNAMRTILHEDTSHRTLEPEGPHDPARPSGS